MITPRGDRFAPARLERGLLRLLGLGVLLAPAILWREALVLPLLRLDDFVYLAQSRDPKTLAAHLATPHNAHVVPLFRLETFLATQVGGCLQAIPSALTAMTFLTLGVAMLTTQRLVFAETGRRELALGAMATVGFSSVLGPSILWYSASQALACGAALLAMLAALQAWRNAGSWPWLALAAMAATAAALFWTAGYIAGLVAVAFVLPDGHTRSKLGSVVLLVVSGLTAMVVRWFQVTSASLDLFWTVLDQAPARLVSGLGHTAQAIPECLLLPNLGLDSETTPAQGLALSLLFAAAWLVTRRQVTIRNPSIRGDSSPEELPTPRLPRPNPLESAGAALTLLSLLMVYTARGDQSFSNLRALGWYHAIPQLGAVLFLFGWLAEILKPLSHADSSASGAGARAFGLVGWVLLLAVLQGPRIQRVLIDYEGGSARLPGRSSSSRGGLAGHQELALRFREQQRQLARLDQIERVCRAEGIGRDELRRVLGQERVIGMPAELRDLDAFDLLRIPEQTTADETDAIHRALAPFSNLDPLVPKTQPQSPDRELGSRLSRRTRNQS